VRQRFRGRIAGVGSSSGVRVVVGHWTDTPYGELSDAMVETAAGHRVLIAPHEQARDFIAATYTFDEVRLEPISVTEDGDRWRVQSTSLVLDLTLSDRTLLGWGLRAVPRRLAESPAWCTVTDPVARVVMRGVRTRGTAGGDRREYYGATDVRRVVALRGGFDDTDLGSLRPVDPPCRFGFSSTPREPSVTTVVTTVDGEVQTAGGSSGDAPGMKTD
jgi:hypothetical protein